MDHSTKETALVIDNWKKFPLGFTGIVRTFGVYYWFMNGDLHRENGPAVEYDKGKKMWFVNGKRHREDGPAIEYPNGEKEWWLNSIRYTQEEWFDRLTPEQQIKFLWNINI